MSQQEYSEWQEYYSIEPFTADRTEMQLATLSFLTSTTNGGKSKFADFLVSNKNKPKTKINPKQKTVGFVQSLITTTTS